MDILLSHVYPSFPRSYISRMRLETYETGPSSLEIYRGEDRERFTNVVRRMDWLPTRHKTRLLEDIRNQRSQILVVLALTMAPNLKKLSLRCSGLMPHTILRLFLDAVMEQRLNQLFSASKEPGILDKLSYLKFRLHGRQNELDIVVVIMALPSLRRLRLEEYAEKIRPNLHRISYEYHKSDITSLCFRYCDISAGALTWLVRRTRALRHFTYHGYTLNRKCIYSTQDLTLLRHALYEHAKDTLESIVLHNYEARPPPRRGRSLRHYVGGPPILDFKTLLTEFHKLNITVLGFHAVIRSPATVVYIPKEFGIVDYEDFMDTIPKHRIARHNVLFQNSITYGSDEALLQSVKQIDRENNHRSGLSTD